MISWSSAFILSMHCLCFWGAYKSGKYFGFCQGLSFLRKKGIQRSADEHAHYCNVTIANVACFEREGELWVKEYCGPDTEGKHEREGRTYLVFHCPWCGYQTERSKLREKIECPKR